MSESLKERLLRSDLPDIALPRARQILAGVYQSNYSLAYWDLPEWPQLHSFWDTLPDSACFADAINTLCRLLEEKEVGRVNPRPDQRNA